MPTTKHASTISTSGISPSWTLEVSRTGTGVALFTAKTTTARKYSTPSSQPINFIGFAGE